MTANLEKALRWGMCYTCGEKLTKFRASVVTPQDAITGRSAFPPSHTDCARQIAKETGGTCCVWIAREPSRPMLGQGQRGESVASFQLPPAVAFEWYAEGREAYRDEAIMALKAMIPGLLLACNENVKEFQDLGRRVFLLVPNLPRQSSANVPPCPLEGCGMTADDPQVLGCTREDCGLFGSEGSRVG